MKGKGRFWFSLFFATFMALGGLAFSEVQDTVFEHYTEQVPLIYLADTLSKYEPDVAPLHEDRVVNGNSETVFGAPHLLITNDFLIKPVKKSESNEWFFLIVLVCLAIVSIALIFYPYYSKQFFRSVVDTIRLGKIKKEEYFENKTPKYLLTVNFLVVFSLLLVQTLEYLAAFSFLVPFGFIVKFGFVLGFVVIIYLLKRGVERFFSWVFDSKQALQAHLDVTIFFLNLTGIVLLPLVVINYFNPVMMGVNFPWIVLFLIFFVKISRRSVVWFKYSKLPLSYIILYLCAVELAPLLIVVKIATTTLNF